MSSTEITVKGFIAKHRSAEFKRKYLFYELFHEYQYLVYQIQGFFLDMSKPTD